MHAEDGELRTADVGTPSGLVLEFQHAAIEPAERRAREAFYGNMVWIVDGTWLKRDAPRVDTAFGNWRKSKEGTINLLGQQMADRGDVDKAQEALGGLAVAGGDAAGVLGFVEAPLYEVAQPAKRTVDGHVQLAGWDGRHDVACCMVYERCQSHSHDRRAGRPARNQLPTERHLQNCDTDKMIRAAALAEWRGLLAA